MQFGRILFLADCMQQSLLLSLVIFCYTLLLHAVTLPIDTNPSIRARKGREREKIRRVARGMK